MSLLVSHIGFTMKHLISSNQLVRGKIMHNQVLEKLRSIKGLYQSCLENPHLHGFEDQKPIQIIIDKIDYAIEKFDK
jgi:hypothetical protein